MMAGLFGQLSNAYTQKKLRKRQKFEQFVRKQILHGIFAPSSESQEDNTQDTTRSSVSSQEASADQERMSISNDDQFNVGYSHPSSSQQSHDTLLRQTDRSNENASSSQHSRGFMTAVEASQ